MYIIRSEGSLYLRIFSIRMSVCVRKISDIVRARYNPTKETKETKETKATKETKEKKKKTKETKETKED